MGQEQPLDEFFTDVQIAKMLGYNPVTLRQWRVKNKKLGEVRYGPPYEIRGGNVVYPKKSFREWCAGVKVIGGVPHVNLPVGVTLEEIQQATANDQADPFAEIGRLAAGG
jgi:hypothetical protein